MAAKVDPGQLVKNNIPLVVAYGLAILPLILWFVMVEGGAHAEFSSEARALKKASSKASRLASKAGEPAEGEEPLYTAEDVERFQAQATVYKEQLRALGDVVRERDAVLERWFDKFKGVDKPQVEEFRTEWTNVAIPNLIERYKEIVIPEGGDADTARVYKREPGKNQLEEAQKIYWIQQAIFEAILKATGGNAEVLTEPQFSREKPVDGQIYQTTRARIELSCSFRDLPKIVRELLAQPICIRVSDLELTKAPFQINNTELRLNVDGMGSTFTDDYYSSELDDASLFPGEAKLEEILPEPAVKLTLSLEVFDFEPPAPEPAEDEGAGEDASDEGEE